MDYCLPQYHDDILPGEVSPDPTHSECNFASQHWSTPEGHPEGGSSYGTGFAISWQNGPLTKEIGGTKKRYLPNGAFVETVVGAVLDRLLCYQDSKFRADENEEAIQYLQAALRIMHRRTADRKKRGVEGTYNE